MQESTMSAGPYLVGIAFWIFVGAVSIAGIVAEYKRRRLNVDLLRYSIDKGQPLDPVLVDRLMTQERQDDAVNPDDLQMGGIITAASGAGICMLALFMARVAAWALYPIMGAGVLAICVGIGLIIAAKTLRRSRERARKNTP
jgi:hypothetical protein